MRLSSGCGLAARAPKRESVYSTRGIVTVFGPQMLDDAKAGILAAGWRPGAAHALTMSMLCDDGYTRILMLPEPNEKKLAKFVRGLEDTLINARATRYLFMMYSDERLMIGAADANGSMCCGYFEIVHGPAGGAFGDWHVVDAKTIFCG